MARLIAFLALTATTLTNAKTLSSLFAEPAKSSNLLLLQSRAAPDGNSNAEDLQKISTEKAGGAAREAHGHGHKLVAKEARGSAARKAQAWKLHKQAIEAEPTLSSTLTIGGALGPGQSATTFGPSNTPLATQTLCNAVDNNATSLRSQGALLSKLLDMWTAAHPNGIIYSDDSSRGCIAQDNSDAGPENQVLRGDSQVLSFVSKPEGQICKMDGKTHMKYDPKPFEVFGKMKAKGATRNYVAIFPSSVKCTQNNPCPSVFALHGVMESTDPKLLESWGLLRYARHDKQCLRGLGSVLVFPQLVEGESWVADGPLVFDNFVVPLFEQLAKNENLDRDRVAILGYSAGAVGALIAAIRRPDIFAVAVAAAASLPQDAWEKVSTERAIPDGDITPQVHARKKLNLMGIDSHKSLRASGAPALKLKLVMVGLGLNDTENDVQPDRNFEQVLRVLGEAKLRTQLNVRFYDGLQHPEVWEAVFNHWGNFHEVVWKGHWSKLNTPWDWYREILIALIMVIIGTVRVYQNLKGDGKKDTNSVDQSKEASKPSVEVPPTEHLPEATKTPSKEDDTDEGQRKLEAVRHEINANTQEVVSHASHLPLLSALECLDSNSDRAALRGAGDRRPYLSHKQLFELVARQADNLKRILGDGSSSHVAVVMPQGPEALTVLLSCFAAGIARTAPFDPKLSQAEVSRLLSDEILGVTAAIISSGEAGAAARASVSETQLPLVLVKQPSAPTASGSFELEATKNFAKHQVDISNYQKCENPLLMLSTSGTTGKAKWVQQPASGILLGARLIAGSLNLRLRDVQLNVMPLHHIGGICCSFASFVSGGTLLCAEAFEPDGFCEQLKSNPAPTWYYSAPTIHQAVANAVSEKKSQHSLRLARSGAAAIPPALVEKLGQTLGCVVLPTYSMSECMPICATLIDGAGLDNSSVGLPIGPSLRIADPEGRAMPYETLGEVQIKQPGLVTPGYLGEGGELLERTKDGWLRTGDLGTIDNKGCVKLTGRSKEVINRAGETLAPSAVEDCLMRLPNIADVMAFAVPSTDLGETVAAVVVPAGGDEAAVSLAQIWRGLEGNTARNLWPELIIYMDSVPKGRTGKKLRVRFHEKLEGFAGKLPAAYRGVPAGGPKGQNRVHVQVELTEVDTGLGGSKGQSSSSTEDEVCEQGSQDGPKAQLLVIWREVLGLSLSVKVDEDASLWTLGGRSQELAMIVARVRATFGLTAAQLPITTAMASPTLAGIAKVVERVQGKLASKSGDMKSAKGDLLVPLGADSGEDRPIVIIVAGRAKSVLRFGPLASAFPNIQFFGIERPGRGSRADDKVENNPPAEAQEVAHQFAVAIAERVGDKPVVLAGACFGCLWAFAVAYELEQIGCRPARLVTFDGGCPSQDGEAYTKQTALIADFLSSGPSEEDVDNFLKSLQNEHEKFDDEMGMDLLQCWQWDNEAYTTLLQELAPKPGENPAQINCPISVFRATEDQDAFMRFRDDREWARYTTTGPFGYTPMKVTHFELMSTVMQKAEHDADFRVELEGLFDASTSAAGADEMDGARLVCPWQFFSRLEGGSISLIDEKEERVSQAELAQYALELASWMHSQGVEVGSKVLLLSIPGRFCLASQLALIHLGAVAVPMNEEAGESGEYLQQLGETAGCTHILCEEAPSLPMFCSLRVLAAKTGFDRAAAQATATELVPAFVARSAAATILFSSGSTGKPKGVVQSVGSLLDLAADTVPQAAPRLWSGSIGWIANYALPPALVGQALLVVPSKVRADPFLFQGIRSRNGVERLTISPSELRAFLAVPGCLKDLSTIVCMAEALPQSVALDYYAQYPSSRLEETYASSEVQGTNAFLSTAVPRDGTTGRFKVRAGQGAVLLDPKDPSRKVEKFGEVGELLLVPTAGGYLNSEQTKQRFIPNPFGPGQLFRTGDLCSWVDAETLKIEGRVDFQVKVSGQLVALEQVEAAAESLDGIKAAAARTFVRASGTTAIALYLEGNEKMGVDGARTALAKKLPSYAIPANIEFLDSIPLLSSGKKDRKSLPEPEDSEDVTDSIGLVRTVGMRQAMEHDAGQALFGLSALALPLLHWLPHEMPNESTFFQKEMDVLQVMASHLSVPLLAVVVGYMDGRAARTTRETLQQCIMVYAIYVLMAWPLLVGGWAQGIATFHRWSCIAFVMYRLAPVALKYFKVPIWVAAACCYVLAPVLGRRPLDVPMVRDGPNAWQEPSLIFFEPQFYGTVGMMFKDLGSYLMAYYMASALVPNMMQSVFKRSTKVAVSAGAAWALLTIGQTFIDDPYDSTKAPEVADWPRYFGYCYPLRVLTDWLSVACLVTCVGEGCILLRMMGRSLVGTFLVHMYFEINLAAIINGLRPLGGTMQITIAILVTACYVLTVGSMAQIFVVGILRVFKMNS